MKHSPDWDIEKGKHIHVSPMKKTPPDHVKQTQKDVRRSFRKMSPRKIEDFFKRGPPEKREQKDMANEDLESYVHELNKPMQPFGRGGRKSHTLRRNTKNKKSRRISRKHSITVKSKK